MFDLPAIPEQIFATYKFVDEFISMLVEDSATELYQIVDTHIDKKSQREQMKSELIDCVTTEIKHRRAVGYPALQDDDDPENEAYFHYTAKLKKYVDSILYLSTESRQEGIGRQQAIYALAAGIAMLFATATAFYFQQRYGAFTLPLLAALVVGYMFKDRIKETIRGFFMKNLESNLYDHRIVIRSLDHRTRLGILREKMSFTTVDELPGSIRKRRQHEPANELDKDLTHEVIIRHDKEITLFNQAFEVVFPQMPLITGINDITRYDIRPFLRKMSEPYQRYTYLNTDGFHESDYHRVYFLHFLSRYKTTGPEKEKLYSHIKLKMDRDGICEIDMKSTT